MANGTAKYTRNPSPAEVQAEWAYQGLAAPGCGGLPESAPDDPDGSGEPRVFSLDQNLMAAQVRATLALAERIGELVTAVNELGR